VYVHLGDVLVAQDAWAWRSPFGMTFFHVDHQGTPIARSDAWGVVFERTRRGSFGLPLVGPLKDGPGYTGHMEDPGTGLVYMQQRYYDPAIARFLSVDPVGPLADPTNHFGRYHYGLNNPYRFTDPDGRCALGTRIETASCDGFNGLSVGQMIDRQGEAAAMRGDHGMTAVAALGKGLWTMAGAEELSKWVAGQSSSGVGVGLEVLAAVPVVGAIARGGVAARATASTVLAGRSFVTARSGITVAIPEGWIGRVADNGKGIVYQRPGAIGNADMIRIMDPTSRYPSGYVRYYNQHGQPLDALGKPGSRDATHIPLNYRGPILGWP
jgi:RHS repeat-associated protein